MTASRPERPSLPAQKVGGPNSSPSAGQIVGERRAREIKAVPRRRPKTEMVTISVKLPKVIIEAIDDGLVKKFGLYPNRAAAIRAMVTQEVPRLLAECQAENADNPVPNMPYKGDKKRKIVSITMPRQLFIDVEKMAKELGFNRSELVRIMIHRGCREFRAYQEVLHR
jgi:metal-responsive CopG/Arc/MetJ family transcriptional regulator